MVHVAGISTCGACGQLLIYYTIKTFGPLVFTIIMATRQLLSIVISCIIYGHTLSWKRIAGIIIVFGTIAVRIYLSCARSRRRTLVSPRDGESLHPTLEKPVSARLASPHSSSGSLAALNRARTPSSP